jgi:lysophospholipase L1-like esterase
VGHGVRFIAGPAFLSPPNVDSTPLNAEVVTVSAVVGDVLTVVRGVEGSTAREIGAGWSIGQGLTAGEYDALASLVAGKADSAGTTAALALKLDTATAVATFAAGTDITKPVRNFMRRLRTAVLPAAVLVQGDSTGNATDEWVYLTTQWLAGLFPAYTVRHRIWNITTEGYDAPTVLQVGTAGLRRFIDPGISSASKRIFSIPDSATTSVTGDIDIRVRVNLAGGAVATRSVFAGKYTSAGNQISWRFGIDPDNTIFFSWSANGSALVGTFSSTTALSGSQLSSDVYLRVTLDVDNGATGSDLKFYTSTDGVAWTQLGSTVTNAGVTSIFDGTSGTQFVGFNGSTFGGGVAPNVSVEFLGLQIFPGLTGVAPVVDLDFGQYNGYSASWVDHCGNTVSANVGALGTISGAFSFEVYNASASGTAVAYSYDAARFAKQAVGTVQLAFVNYGHNDALVNAYRTPYKTLTDLIVAKWTDVGVVCVAQNGEVTPRSAGEIATQAIRMQQIVDLAASQGFQLVDAFDALQATDATLVSLMSVDGVHPNAAGQLVWTAALQRLMRSASSA